MHRSTLALLCFGVTICFIAQAREPIQLPIEIAGADGVSASVTVELSGTQAAAVRSLWMQLHGVGYADMASVQVNTNPWQALNNENVAVAEPGKSYGGIGGGFSTLQVALPLPAGTAVSGVNTIRFRFNRTDGLESGFRVLNFNFAANDGRRLLSKAEFAEEDPNTWTAPLRDPADLAGGKNLWYAASLAASNLPGAVKLRAHCSDCHAQDGRDLKYFNYSNTSIVARSRFHGLSEREGQQIASYIRSLAVPNPGRPWNPPYQPGPGLEAQPVANWAAGAGLAWVLDNDSDALPYLFGQPEARATGAALRITPDHFRPDNNLNAREVPIALQLPDWNHWLPRVHPLDAWGAAFSESDLAGMYQSPRGKTLRAVLGGPDLRKLVATGDAGAMFEDWSRAQRKFLARYRPEKGSPELTNKVYSSQLWQLVKTWELMQEFNLEGRAREFFGPAGESRSWFNTVPAGAAPASVNIPDGPNGMGGSALTNEYFDNSWYELQLLVNSGSHRRRDKLPIDWVYMIGRFLDLQRQSHRAEPGRLLVAVIKAMQSADPKIGPSNESQGWRPNRNVDPRIMTSADWAPMFQPLSASVRTAITESFLSAWLDKNLQYPLPQYFYGEAATGRYTTPTPFEGISGGSAWRSAPEFQAAGVSPEVVRRLVAWGKSYSDMAGRLRY